ncbi:AAA family ATPase [Spirochaetia bacterium 38H-sp]|uniref:Chromosome partition protein Smc n=1 Tax=Rarispira pelagica TaxID=3141764 RepID=A0ABU9UB28_9SPIR
MFERGFVVLKSIELFGFKSFADRTRIELAEGATAIVGPNGCGKSNIVDALKWVLGEQAYKSLRASSMEEVIFNGTEYRKPVNVAEVSLVFSNDEKVLPLDVAEIEVKRRMYRSGENEYFINGAQVRLKDVRELFFDTGIGKSSYSILEQGKIDQILSTKPEDRRYVFEEAAGITRYRAREKEAEHKLAKTRENMEHVESILSEVKKQYDSLKKQADKAEKYRQLSEGLFRLEVAQAVNKLRGLEKQSDRAQKKLDDARKNRDELKAKIDKLNESMEDSLDFMNSMEAELSSCQKSLYGLEVKRNSVLSQIRLLSEQLGEIEGKIETDKIRIKGLYDRMERIKRSIVEKQEEKERADEEISRIGRNVDSFKQSIALTEQKIESYQSEIKEREEEIEDLEKRLGALQGELTEITDVIVSKLDEGLKQVGFSVPARRRLKQELQNKLERFSIILRGKKERFEDAQRVGDFSGIGPELWSELDEVLAEIKELYRQYVETEPLFLEDFLSPEGFITKKRNVDEALKDVRGKIQDNRSRISYLRLEIEDCHEKNAERRATLEELNVSLARLDEVKKAVDETIAGFERDFEETRKTAAALEEEQKMTQNRKLAVEEGIFALEEEKLRIDKEEDELKKRIEAVEESIRERNKAISSGEQQLKASVELLSSYQQEVEKAQIELTRLRGEIEAIKSFFKEQHGRSLDEFKNIDIPDDLSSRIAAQKQEIRSLGNVNFMATEEFRQISERYEFLTSQIADLEKAERDLEGVVTQIRKESSELFVDAYEKIKKNFHIIFRRLFGGGRAEIKLVDPDNPLSSGISILAQPPGKKLEHIGLLSGGERSMTAVALLFAMYMVKPSPFCILDEIDAALDEGNVGRFVNMLREFSSKSQFIVITHNKKTVSGTDSIVGITMEESGVSKVISIRISQEEEREGTPV